MTSAIDRRVLRTRASLHHTLLQLVMSQGYDAISVQDICEAANIGRSTFYAHYTSKDDLKRSGLDHLKAILTAGRLGPTERFDFVSALFSHAGDHLGLYQALKGTPGEAVSINAVRRILIDLVREGARTGSEKSSEASIQFVVGGLMGLLLWWLDNGATQPAEEMAVLVRRLISEGIA